MLELMFYGHSVKGKRANNQDAIIAEKIGEDTYFFAVADGMGGTKGGEVASQTLIDVGIQKVKKEFCKKNFSSGNHKALLKDIVIQGNKELLKKSKSNPEIMGMGTTLAAMLFHKEKYVWLSIGDSRIYKYDEGEFKQITTDHSYIQEYKEENDEELSEEMVKKYGHIITRTIDGSEDEPRIYPENELKSNLKMGDAFLLCSDGLLIDRVESSDFLGERFYQSKDLRIAGDRMINYAMNNGSTDNISVILIDTNKDRKVSKLIRKDKIDLSK